VGGLRGAKAATSGLDLLHGRAKGSRIAIIGIGAHVIVLGWMGRVVERRTWLRALRPRASRF
jgi:hypothetical protein